MEVTESDSNVSLVPLVRYASSKIRAQKSTADYRNWTQGGKHSKQTRDTEGLIANKIRPPVSEPQLLGTWELKPSGFHEERARYCPGYRWAVHGVLNPRYGAQEIEPTGEIPHAPDNHDSLQTGASDTDHPATVSQVQPCQGSSEGSSGGRILQITPNPSVSDYDFRPSSPPSSDIPKFRDVRGVHDQGERTSAPVFNETGSPFLELPSKASSVAPLSCLHQRMSHGNKVDRNDIRTSEAPQGTQVVGSLRNITRTELTDRADTLTNTSCLTNRDVLASLNREICRNLEDIRKRTLQRIVDGALDTTLRDGPMREAVQEMFNLASQPPGYVSSVSDTDSIHDGLKLETTATIKDDCHHTENCEDTAHQSAGAEQNASIGWGAVVSDAVHRVLGEIAPAPRVENDTM